MKTIIAISIAFTLVAINSFAQLRGSGKTVTKIYEFKNFDKINLTDLDGKVVVEVGKPFQISATIDDNLLDLLSVEENEKSRSLSVALKGNKNNRKYIEDTNIKITICLPNVTAISHFGNSVLNVNNISGALFQLENGQNANATLNGTVTNFEVINSGNGNTQAENLIAKNATIRTTGNGNAIVNAADYIIAKASGNSTIRNKGKAKFDVNSSKSGNARLLN